MVRMNPLNVAGNLLGCVPYKLRIDKEEFNLIFKHTIQFNRKIGKDLDRETYRLNGRKYKSNLSFPRKNLIEEITDDVDIREDEYHHRVLHCYTSIPTFDSGDREWDSAIDEYLMFDGKDVNLVYCRGGYRIAKMEVYCKLISAPSGLRAYWEKLGFPAEGIHWR